MKSLYYESFVPDNQLAADVRLFRRCAVSGHGISFPTMPPCFCQRYFSGITYAVIVII